MEGPRRILSAKNSLAVSGVVGLLFVSIPLGQILIQCGVDWLRSHPAASFASTSTRIVAGVHAPPDARCPEGLSGPVPGMMHGITELEGSRIAIRPGAEADRSHLIIARRGRLLKSRHPRRSTLTYWSSRVVYAPRAI
ncbi:hypothetical protein BD310DRAFT_478454 [Dichomitus squalens]|uniref:Uncharacterized protein n=1 Tax=Dichomitus squalens TaxID=114155 RepID=A0A4Q9PV34_9APHY|nr:hypothetical protein BD310DRAFT_478454 [Dichomitus squalens]